MMDFSKHFLAVTLLLISSAHIFSSAGRDVATKTYNCCIGNCIQMNCQTGTANAIGDKKRFTKQELAGVTFNDLGTLSASREIELALPSEGEYVGHTVKFSFGPLANRPIKFMTTCKKQEDGKMEYKFYRQLLGETVWTEVGSIYAEIPLTTTNPVICPDGVILSVEEGKKIGVVYIATEALNVPKEVRNNVKLK